MATSALVCLNIKTRARAENDNSDESTTSKNETSNDEVNITSLPSARLLIQTLIDNGIISANNRATVRIIDNTKALDVNLHKNNETKIIIPGNADKVRQDVKTFNLGSFIVKQEKSDSASTSKKDVEHSTKIGDQLKNPKAKTQNDLVIDQEGVKQRRIVLNQNSGNFIRLCQNQNVVLEGLGNVGLVPQGNLVFPVSSGSNLILSDGSLVIPVQRLDAQKEEKRTEDCETRDDNGYGIVFSQAVDRSVMESEPPPLLILPTEDQQTKPTQNSVETFI